MKHKNPYVADSRTRQAKQEGYPARSVYKLEEIDRRCQLLHASIRVLDLGAAPGSWTLYVAKRVGLQGLVVAVDLKLFAQPFPANVIAIQADALQPTDNSWQQYAPYDLVLSDMAPNTSGSKIRDQTLSFELFECALSVAGQVAKPSSDFVAKLFMSDNFPAAKTALARAYTTVRVIRPDSTRQNSSELFLVGRCRR